MIVHNECGAKRRVCMALVVRVRKAREEVGFAQLVPVVSAARDAMWNRPPVSPWI
jgi:hypothetical protein